MFTRSGRYGTMGTVRTIVYDIPGRPEVEVLVDDRWWFGALRMWTHEDDGTWTAQVTYSRDGENRIGSFPADQVRLAEGDYRPPSGTS